MSIVTVSYDLTPAEKENAIREKLVAMGWTPPTEDYVLVPVEPTEKMIEAGNSLSYMTCDVIYRAMIKVAQEKSDDI